MIRWTLTRDPASILSSHGADLAGIWYMNTDALRRRVRPNDRRPLRLEIQVSPTVARAMGPISARLLTSADMPVGVHLAETLRGPRPTWRMPVRTSSTDGELAARLRRRKPSWR